MKTTISVFLFLISLFTMQAQNLKDILKEVKEGQRIDTLISFDEEQTLEYLPISVIKGKIREQFLPLLPAYTVMNIRLS